MLHIHMHHNFNLMPKGDRLASERFLLLTKEDQSRKETNGPRQLFFLVQLREKDCHHVQQIQHQLQMKVPHGRLEVEVARFPPLATVQHWEATVSTKTLLQAKSNSFKLASY